MSRLSARQAAALLRAAADPALNSGDPWVTDYWPIHRQRLADDLQLLDTVSGKILEVGASPYFTTLALRSLNRDVTAIDISYENVPDGLTVLLCNIETERLPVADDSFDVVLFSEVFEHLRIDPLFTVSELRRVLRPGGTLLLTTPNLRSLRGVLRLVLLGKAWAVGAYPMTEYTKLREQGWMGHVREYTAREVRGVLEGCGFEVVDVIWRRKPGAIVWRFVEWLIPPTRPYMTLVARN